MGKGLYHCMGMKVACNLNGLQIALNIDHSSYIIQDLVDILVVKIGSSRVQIVLGQARKGLY